jgi:uridylate kinase
VASGRRSSSAGGTSSAGRRFPPKGQVIKESTAHYMGMMATIMNGLALQEVLESIGVQTRLQTALRVDSVAEFFIRRRAIRHLEKGRVVILAGGTGNPHVTTDTAAALRGVELECEMLLKATKVDGIYTDDPEKNPHAERYDRLTYSQVLKDQLKVMDLSAIDMCKNNKLQIMVFNYKKEGNIERAVAGHPIGTFVTA